jgi:RNA-binding protein YhbY
MLISRFEEIKMHENKTFNEFYTKINSMVSLGKKVSNAKLTKKILRSLSERFRIKVTTIKESKDLDSMKIEERMGSLRTYESFLPLVKNTKTIALKAAKKKSRVSSEEDIDEEEDAVTMLAKNFSKLVKNDRFKKKFTERIKKDPKEAVLEEGSRARRS